MSWVILTCLKSVCFGTNPSFRQGSFFNFFLPLSRDSGRFFRLDHELFFRPRLLFMSSQTSHWHSLISSFNQWFWLGRQKKRVHGTLEDRELRFGANLGNGKKGDNCYPFSSLLNFALCSVSNLFPFKIPKRVVRRTLWGDFGEQNGTIPNSFDRFPYNPERKRAGCHESVCLLFRPKFLVIIQVLLSVLI